MTHRIITDWRAKPITEDFDIKIISKHPEFNDRSFKQHAINGMRTIGIFKDEPFEIHLTNNYNEDISAIVSLDGVDVLTGKEADLEPSNQKWIVRAGTTLHLKAWHESCNGGSRLVFTSADKSVALHTTGNVSHKGIIAVAIFTEGDRNPYTITHSPYTILNSYVYKGGPSGGRERKRAITETKLSAYFDEIGESSFSDGD